MSGFETVGKLKELEQKDPAWQSQDGSVIADVDYLSALYSAAPPLLDIAGLIRSGDKERFQELIYIIEDMRIDESCPVCEERLVGYKEMLKRYQKMAERMHETEMQ